MKKAIEYSTEDLVLIRKFYGDVTIEDLKSSLNYMVQNELIKKKQKGIISDFREANFLVVEQDFSVLKNLFLENINIFKNIRFAQVIQTSKIAYTMIFERENSSIPTRSFSTIKAAKAWIIK